MDDPLSVSRALVAAAQSSILAFLRIELSLANSLLDGVANLRNAAGRQRRHDRATQACDEVVRYLALDSARSGLSPAEREELSAGLRAVHARLATAVG